MNLLSNVLFLTSASAAPDIFFNLGNFISNLKYMGIGMLVIFVVIGIIIFAINLINYLFSK
ncbi:MAG: hypothetical protein IJE09_00560 [Oscillospiraceae bacterium]|nr:hypothetical protein [Oscillospiraceae bacterium]